MESIILAGGMGTRLQSVLPDVPKCMAPVADKPFLYHLLKALEPAGFKHIILSLGYKHEIIEKWVADYDTSTKITTVVETTPLGTGGAVKLSLSKATQSDVFVLNGDTFLIPDFKRMLDFHKEKKVSATLALKEMQHIDRYGLVETDKNLKIVRFLEKQQGKSGKINGGVYLIRKDALDELPEKFSLEKDFFEKVTSSGRLAGFPVNGYFIDIGVPEDYERAQTDFANETYKTL
ncbi:D-mannose-1-phosphate guanyltransferase [Bacteroidia bacterium]|nr:D-mannose-1-phosphate guanyltransferase [Bacteroidia bacterium]